IREGEPVGGGSIGWRAKRAGKLTICASQRLVVGTNVAGTPIPRQRSHGVAVHLVDDGARAARPGILWVAGEHAVERSQGLAWLAQRQVGLSEHTLNGERTWIPGLQLLAARQRLIWMTRGDLCLNLAQALTQRDALHLLFPYLSAIAHSAQGATSPPQAHVTMSAPLEQPCSRRCFAIMASSASGVK